MNDLPKKSEEINKHLSIKKTVKNKLKDDTLTRIFMKFQKKNK